MDRLKKIFKKNFIKKSASQPESFRIEGMTSKFNEKIENSIESFARFPEKIWDKSELYRFVMERGSKINEITRSFDFSIWNNWDQEIEKDAHALMNMREVEKEYFSNYTEGGRSIGIIFKDLIFSQINEQDINKIAQQMKQYPQLDFKEKLKLILQNMFWEILKEDRPVQIFKPRLYEKGAIQVHQLSNIYFSRNVIGQDGKITWKKASRSFFDFDVNKMIELPLPDGKKIFARVKKIKKTQENKVNQFIFELEISGIKKTDIVIPNFVISKNTPFSIFVKNDEYPVLFKEESSHISILETQKSDGTIRKEVKVKKNGIFKRSFIESFFIEEETNPIVRFKIKKQFDYNKKDNLQTLIPITTKEGEKIIGRAIYEFNDGTTLNFWEPHRPDNHLINMIHKDLKLTPDNELKIFKTYFRAKIVNILFNHKNYDQQTLHFFLKTIFENSKLNSLTQLAFKSLIKNNKISINQLISREFLDKMFFLKNKFFQVFKII